MTPSNPVSLHSIPQMDPSHPCSGSPPNFRSVYPTAKCIHWFSPQSCPSPRLGHLSEYTPQSSSVQKQSWLTPDSSLHTAPRIQSLASSAVLPSKYVLRLLAAATTLWDGATTSRCCSLAPTVYCPQSSLWFFYNASQVVFLFLSL